MTSDNMFGKSGRTVLIFLLDQLTLSTSIF